MKSRKEIQLENDVSLVYKNILLEDVMRTVQGKALLGMLIVSTGFFKNSFVNSNTKKDPEPNALQMAFLEGQRFVGEMLYTSLLTVNPDADYPAVCLTAYREWQKSVASYVEQAKTGRDLSDNPLDIPDNPLIGDML